MLPMYDFTQDGIKQQTWYKKINSDNLQLTPQHQVEEASSSQTPNQVQNQNMQLNQHVPVDKEAEQIFLEAVDPEISSTSCPLEVVVEEVISRYITIIT